MAINMNVLALSTVVTELKNSGYIFFDNGDYATYMALKQDFIDYINKRDDKDFTSLDEIKDEYDITDELKYFSRDSRAHHVCDLTFG